jgi:predicted NBD/HSP70 family sugar kinase
MARDAASAVRPDEIRQHNLSAMLAQIHRDGALTRAELTQRLSVSRSTIGALVGDLTQLGLVEEVVPTGGVGVGRPSHVVAPHRAGPFGVAVDIDVDQVTVAAVGLGGEVLARQVLPTGKHTTTPVGLAELVVAEIPRLCWTGRPGARLAGIGVSVPGTVDRRTGRVGVAPNLGWKDIPLADLLGDLLVDVGLKKTPVAVGNDADLAVLAEHQRGSARNCDDVVYLMGRSGIGAGIIIGGVPLRGYDGHAGEIGHNVLNPAGPLCHCGKHGCTETYIGNEALLRLAGRSCPANGSAVADLYADARAGDVRALAGLRAMADPLGHAIADLLNTLNPQRVLLGGSLAELLEVARPELEAAVETYAFEASTRTVALLAPALGNDSALLGAGEIAFTELLADPLSAAALQV